MAFQVATLTNGNTERGKNTKPCLKTYFVIRMNSNLNRTRYMIDICIYISFVWGRNVLMKVCMIVPIVVVYLHV